MFQYAAGRALADRHGTKLVLDTSWTLGSPGRYELACFDLDAKACPVREVARVPNPSRLVRLLQRLRPSRRRFMHVVDESADEKGARALASGPDDSYLIGFWQSESYFIDQEPAIRRAFTFRPLSAESEQVAERIREAGSGAVSIHVRRGDYTRHRLFSALDEGFYTQAVEAIAGAVDELQLFVFSDDPAWCVKNLRFPYATTVVDRQLPPDREWEDMALMSRCRHHVIANSTYSWWGAWLNPSSDKLVVAPRRWSLDESAADPVPDSWLRV
jgi:Glycosyl transferase family 11